MNTHIHTYEQFLKTSVGVCLVFVRLFRFSIYTCSAYSMLFFCCLLLLY